MLSPASHPIGITVHSVRKERSNEIRMHFLIIMLASKLPLTSPVTSQCFGLATGQGTSDGWGRGQAGNVDKGS
jgi:hypothetical protein